MKKSCGNEDVDVLYKLIASQLNAGGLGHVSNKLFDKEDEMPQPSHWLMHLVMIGRDVLGITGFNFHENPVTPHTSFVNSLQPYYSGLGHYYSQLDISALESPIKHYLQENTISPDPDRIPVYNDQQPTTSFAETELPGSSNKLLSESGLVQKIETESEDITLIDVQTPTHQVQIETIDSSCSFDKATICVGIMPKPVAKDSGNLETVIENLSSQLDVINTEIREEINELSTLSPKPSQTECGENNESSNNPENLVNITLQNEQAAYKEVPKILTNFTVQLNNASETIVPSSQGLTIEELEPIATEKPKRKRRKVKTLNKGEKKKSESVTENTLADVGPSCSNADPSQAGETELMSDLQRVLTSNIMSISTHPKKSRAPKTSSKFKSVPIMSLDEQTLIAKMAQDTAQPSFQDCSDPTLNSKLLTELQRLLTQNNIRSALQGEKNNPTRRKQTRPSLESPPYIRPPQAHDSASLDGSRFTLDKPRMFSCLQCNKEFKTKQCLKRHVSRHLGLKPHACTYCGKRFNERQNMMRHLVAHIDLRKFVCDVCDEAFYRKEVMELHKRRKHTIPDDILNCRFKKCDFTCNVPSKLVEHIQTVHFNNFRYNCDKCNYKTQHNANYLKHLRVHTGERPYKCPKCGRGFKQPNALRVHSLVHLDRPNKCEICLKTFTLELALRIHYENNHGPRAAQKKIHEKKKREILRKYRQQRSVHSKNLSFVNVMPTKI